MLSKGLFENIKDKAKVIYNDAQKEAQNTLGDLKKEIIKAQDKIVAKIDEQISEENNLSLKDDNLVSNATFNKAAQLLIEKSTKQAEQFLDKYIRPYDVHEITNSVFAKQIIEEIKCKNKDGKFNDIYYSELAVLFINLSEFDNALEYIEKISNPTEKNDLMFAFESCKMNDSSFLTEYEKHTELLIKLRIYLLSRRYSDLCLNNKQFSKAKESIEKCCLLNPTSIKDQKDLLQCYQQLNEEYSAKIQKIIVDNLE
jgi:hypothetical protein